MTMLLHWQQATSLFRCGAFAKKIRKAFVFVELSLPVRPAFGGRNEEDSGVIFVHGGE